MDRGVLNVSVVNFSGLKSGSHRARLVLVVFMVSLFIETIQGTLEDSPAYAGGTCNNAEASNYLEGYGNRTSSFYPNNEPEQVEGISGNLRDAPGYILCSGATSYNDSSSWVMMANPIGNDGWAQAGTFYQEGFPCVEEWAQEEQTSAQGFQNYFVFQNNQPVCSSSGSTYHYWVQLYYTGSEYVYRMNIGSFVIDQTTWSPLTSWSSSPWWAQFAGETTYPQSDIPGSSSQPYDYSGLQVQSYANNSWGSLCGNQAFGPFTYTNYAEYAVSCSEGETWTSHE